MKKDLIRLSERRVRTLLKQHRISTPPVPLERLVEGFGASLQIRPASLDIRGFVVRASRNTLNRDLIFINSKHSPNTQRFTLAHEIGHLLIDFTEIHFDGAESSGRRKGATVRRNADEQDEEAVVDQFAAELLMPKDMLTSDLKARTIDPNDDDALKRLAARYHVSLIVLTLRLRQLELLPLRLEGRSIRVRGGSSPVPSPH